jgi:hypothetical protein
MKNGDSSAMARGMSAKVWEFTKGHVRSFTGKGDAREDTFAVTNVASELLKCLDYARCAAAEHVMRNELAASDADRFAWRCLEEHLRLLQEGRAYIPCRLWQRA